MEVHDRDELRRAARVGARLIGVNNRDLRDFSVDSRRTELLLAEMPAGTTVVSESGISAPEQLRLLEARGRGGARRRVADARARSPPGAGRATGGCSGRSASSVTAQGSNLL